MCSRCSLFTATNFFQVYIKMTLKLSSFLSVVLTFHLQNFMSNFLHLLTRFFDYKSIMKRSYEFVGIAVNSLKQLLGLS
ncbi:hypothetical protein EB796_023905 [Bugula neritina]|uniref:Uncharacterized protein n=1 Tax=Bugula neritina TaxID=10212 RepID=A0A7J7IW71_BUGNE|nr:hypothetical protein EB796_023905 [Bugula neritina]